MRFAQTLQGSIRSPAFEYFFLGLAERSGTHVREFSQAVGRGKARTNIVDEDTVLAELIRETLDQSDNRGTHGIRIDKVGHRLLGGNGRDGDDASPVFLLHVRDNLVREVNGAHEVHFDGALPLVNGGGEKALGGRASSIGHADIRAAEFLNHRIDEIADSARVSDIERLGEHFRLVLAANLFGDGVERFPVPRADGQMATFGGEGLGGGTSDPLAGCGNDGDAVPESGFHSRVIIMDNMGAARYIWIHDSLRPASEGVVPFVSAAVQYGFSVFEGIRCYSTDRGPAVFRMDEHVERLMDSAHIVGFRDLPVTAELVKTAINQTIAANEFSACYIRPMIYLDGAMSLTVEAGEPRFVVAVWEWKTFLGAEAKERGIRANIASFTRLHPNIMMTKAKVSGNYVSSILAKTESQRAGFDEAIMLGPDGYVAECTGENLFLVRNKIIYTTPRAGILEGITRDSLITLARDLGYSVVEEPISRDQLYIADEVFVCGTAAEVVGLREIDFRVIGDGKAGPVTRALQQEFDKLVSGRHTRSAQWLAPVPALNAAAVRS
jgi:branched-chain amino acid aminotransferase